MASLSAQLAQPEGQPGAQKSDAEPDFPQQVPPDPFNSFLDSLGFPPGNPDRGGFGPPPGMFGPGGPGSREDLKLVKKYDQNENGRLDGEERIAARAAAKQEGEGRQGGFPPPGGGRRGPGNREPAQPGRLVDQTEVKSYRDASLYEPTVLRTLFFEFENADWEQELEDFHGTDVEVPATLIVDGKTYENVGMSFRGMSSYGMVPTGYKRSFNVSIDLADEEQRLYDYKTLNLLNSAGDPSFMSTVLYSHIANQYLPAPKANHVHVIINGESWGIYVNVQQFNKEFLAEHFDSTQGTRWKVSGSPGGDGGLRYLGDEIDEYKKRYEIKSNDGKKAWQALIELCRTLDETPPEKLEQELEPILDLDGVLRFLALDVALVNSDGYWTRASDYSLFLDHEKRFHVFPHDMNEAFSAGHGPGPGGPPGGPGGFGPPPEGFRPPEGFAFPPGGFGPPPDGFGPPPGGNFPGAPENGRPGGRPGGPGGPGHGGFDLDPLISLDNPRMPLRSKLLAVPSLRAKYLKYVREIADKSLAWDQIQPVLALHTQLIQDEVAADTRKLYSLEAFQRAVLLDLGKEETREQSIQGFLEKRRDYLHKYRDPESKVRGN
ncbi:MAG: CotH kinase family protein [Planctomycetaceae bacterium]|nr:CotH kinase family protein [Planctomycetaceae bacterium]